MDAHTKFLMLKSCFFCTDQILLTLRVLTKNRTTCFSKTHIIVPVSLPLVTAKFNFYCKQKKKKKVVRKTFAGKKFHRQWRQHEPSIPFHKKEANQSVCYHIAMLSISIEHSSWNISWCGFKKCLEGYKHTEHPKKTRPSIIVEVQAMTLE